MLAFHYDTIDSTNDEAKRLLQAGRIARPAFLLAREQTNGRGSRGRRWCSPRDAGIYLTVVDFPGCPVREETRLFTLAAGVACVEALEAAAGLEVRLKPINDLFVRGRKLGGILTETIVENQRVAALITGIGVNVHRASRPVDPPAAEPICLAESLPFPRFARVDLERLTALIIARLLAWNRVAALGDADAVRSAWSLRALGPPDQADGVG
ncbi:MAG: biotin--[acetyl-CoA-carboxylase] ligase [Planctomycetota bacterium]|nr:MAG: biotin--[acetyl-CoA-carboxylase] ligase [Planctomycetota bacterium]